MSGSCMGRTWVWIFEKVGLHVQQRLHRGANVRAHLVLVERGPWFPAGHACERSKRGWAGTWHPQLAHAQHAQEGHVDALQRRRHLGHRFIVLC